jgi:8-hydroxy-5-deazaflavin:NADPH oxidoreductase
VRIAVIGRGNVGGGLADRWERVGHEVTRLGATAATSPTRTR